MINGILNFEGIKMSRQKREMMECGGKGEVKGVTAINLY